MRCHRLALLAIVLVTGACATMPSRSATDALIAATIDSVVPGLPAGTTLPASDAGSPAPQLPPTSADPISPDPTADRAAERETRATEERTASDRSGVASSPLAELVRPIDSALYDPAEHIAAPRPLTISIPSLDVQDAPVDPVGVKDEGELDVPDPRVVGWYTGSPVPGEGGASVLAAHVNYDGVPGVFRYLRDLELGALVEVAAEDGTVQTFEVTAVELYDKDELPEERVWAKTGDPTLVLFTCGGRFNDDQRSYEDNVVAFARPISRP